MDFSWDEDQLAFKDAVIEFATKELNDDFDTLNLFKIYPFDCLHRTIELSCARFRASTEVIG